MVEYSVASEGATITSRTWKEEGFTFDTDNNPNPSITLMISSTTIELTVTDNAGAGRTDSISHAIGAQLPLPKWKEIAPF